MNKKERILKEFWENYEKDSKLFSNLNNLNYYANGVINGFYIADLISADEWLQAKKTLDILYKKKKEERINGTKTIK